jgi:hypothetical protein
LIGLAKLFATEGTGFTEKFNGLGQPTFSLKGIVAVTTPVVDFPL